MARVERERPAPTRAVAKSKKPAVSSATRALAPIGSASISKDLRDKYRQHIQRTTAVAAGGSGWPFVSTKGGVFTLNDVAEEEMEVIILGEVRENVFYPEAYDPDEQQRPTCFAIGEAEEEMAPPADLTTREADSCRGCHYNKFGSADQGRGKKCKNSIRLCLLPADLALGEDADRIAEAEGMRLRVPVMSVKNFAKYANAIARGEDLPLFMIVTRIGIVPDQRSQYKLTFAPVGVVEDPDVIDALAKKVEEAKTYLTQLPQAAADEPAEEKADDDRPRRGAEKKRQRTTRATKAAAAPPPPAAPKRPGIRPLRP